MMPISPKEVRYIKLGSSDRWIGSAFENDRIEFGQPDIPHDMALAGDWDGIVEIFVNEQGKSRSKARDLVREIRDFYGLGTDCLWITFAKGHLWWAFAAPEVHWIGGDGADCGHRYRKTIGPWCETTIHGEPLRQAQLSSRLTRVAHYRQTVCRVEAEQALVRRINGEEEPIVAEANRARQALIAVAERMIEKLHWRDFEIMVDLIFARSGWQRISEIGGAQKDIDLALEQPTTGDRAFVQVKSSANEAEFQGSVRSFRENGFYTRMFFVCHSPKGHLSRSDDSSIAVWTGDKLAVMAVKSGLFDWLLEKVA